MIVPVVAQRDNPRSNLVVFLLGAVLSDINHMDSFGLYQRDNLRIFADTVTVREGNRRRGRGRYNRGRVGDLVISTSP